MARLTELSANLNAFLDLIAASEGTPVIPGSDDDGYNVLAGATQKRPVLFDFCDYHTSGLNHVTRDGEFPLLKGLSFKHSRVRWRA